MEMMLYTLVGVFLYFASDWILVKIEHALDRKIDNRNLVFFAIILTLALTTFALIRLFPLQ